MCRSCRPAHAPTGSGLAAGSLRITPGTNRRLRVFATTQIAFWFVMLAGAATLLATLIALQTANTGYDMRQVLAIDLPMQTLGSAATQDLAFYQEVTRKIGELPGVDGVSIGNFTPWRDAGTVRRRRRHWIRRRRLHAGEWRRESARPPAGRRARFLQRARRAAARRPRLHRRRSPRQREPVVIVSQSVAQRIFPNGDALNHKVWWIDPYFGPKPFPRRIVGVVGDVDDENIVRGAAMTVYHPLPADGRRRPAVRARVRRSLRAGASR